jgi:hypothetical protein
MTETDQKAMIAASKAFLCEPLPDNFYEMDDAEVVAFLEENAWGPLENWSTNEVYEIIEDHAETFKEYGNDLLKMQQVQRTLDKDNGG